MNQYLTFYVAADEYAVTILKVTEIIEDVLNLLYELDYKTDRLYRQVKREKRQVPPPL